MARVPRELFVPVELRDYAYEDAALPLAHGQTVSQPFIVAVTCQGLALEGDERVLDVGTGSGYAAAVLAELAAEVHSIERIPELAEAARASLAAAGYERVQRARRRRVARPARARAVRRDRRRGRRARAAARRCGSSSARARRIVLPLGSRRRQELCAIERTPDGPKLIAPCPRASCRSSRARGVSRRCARRAAGDLDTPRCYTAHGNALQEPAAGEVDAWWRC